MTRITFGLIGMNLLRIHVHGEHDRVAGVGQDTSNLRTMIINMQLFSARFNINATALRNDYNIFD